MRKIPIKELRHAVLNGLKQKLMAGKRAEISFGELWKICSLAGPLLFIPLNSELQRERFTIAFFLNIKFLSSVNFIGVNTVENGERIESIFLTTEGERYIGDVEFVMPVPREMD